MIEKGQITERAVAYETEAHLCFVDLTKAYDSVDCGVLVATLNKNYKVPSHLIDIIKLFKTCTLYYHVPCA